MSQEGIDISQILVSGAVSLTAAFAGAFFAFRFQSQTKLKEIEEQNISAALEALLCLTRMLNHVGAYRKQIIEPVRDERLRHISMPPIPKNTEEYKFDWSKLAFLLATEHANVLNELSLTYTKFQTLINAINERSSLVLSYVQPKAAAAGLKSGEYMATEQGIEGLLGHQIYVSLKRLTDEIVIFADEGFDEICENINNLRSSIRNIYPNASLPDFEIESDA